ncbi:MAG: nucleotidyl transferase AbiEii/AbiGii toxin family protein [candidate division KSB1 bacterium]|nr:nucleotidyl transferase AbiEii/AbiGii toxin family protein [candidate division KSB1 bacterium]MDZ7369157.1 nucleotidyl transferase AbiEii/AbiGii toxin family protein [candidate division KSB1 bacterium]MDZ7407148.1 nucleotidyl transferase AbiEii/AbiGii toxin family protein [candidate division KSB1 bacterium]
MNMKTDSFIAVLKALHEHEVEYILIGGLAVILHGVPRLTEDLDIFVTKDEANLAKLKKALRSVFEDESIEEMTRNDLVDYPVVRYGTPENYYIDIMDRVGEAFKYNDLAYEVIESHGFPIKVATIETLIKLKQGTIRQIDKADVLLLTEKLKEKK